MLPLASALFAIGSTKYNLFAFFEWTLAHFATCCSPHTLTHSPIHTLTHSQTHTLTHSHTLTLTLTLTRCPSITTTTTDSNRNLPFRAHTLSESPCALQHSTSTVKPKASGSFQARCSINACSPLAHAILLGWFTSKHSDSGKRQSAAPCDTWWNNTNCNSSQNSTC